MATKKLTELEKNRKRVQGSYALVFIDDEGDCMVIGAYKSKVRANEELAYHKTSGDVYGAMVRLSDIMKEI